MNERRPLKTALQAILVQNKSNVEKVDEIISLVQRIQRRKEINARTQPGTQRGPL